MAYTQDDLDAVTEAIIQLASGRRVVSARIGDTMVEYGQADLARLRELKAEIAAELQSADGRRRFVLTSTSKGVF
jgi:hypothetical protein